MTKGYVQNDETLEYWLTDPRPGTTPDIKNAGVFERTNRRVIKAVSLGCIFIPIEQENKTMNYIEAVKELVENPKAVAITFPSNSDPRGFRRIELETRMLPVGRYTTLVFPATEIKKKQNAVATSPEFLLREDFSIVYKEEKRYTESQLKDAYETGMAMGVRTTKQSNEEACAKAYLKFKKEMQTIFGE